MSFTVHTSSIRTVRSGDSDFHIVDGIVTCPRAGFEFSEHCLREYRQVIAECIDRGWLKPVAHVRDHELM